MKDQLKEGDAVEWAAPQGTIEGRVEKKLTKPLDLHGHHVAASPQHPEYLVKSDRTGAKAAHLPASLKKRK